MPRLHLKRLFLFLLLCSSPIQLMGQPMTLQKLASFSIRELEGAEQLNGDSVQVIPGFMDSISTRPVDVVGVGYGIESEVYNDYQEVDVAGKILLLWRGQPMIYKNSNFWDRLWWPKAKEKNTPQPLIDSLPLLKDPTSSWELKLYTAYDKGALGVILIDSTLRKPINQELSQILLSDEKSRPFFAAWASPSTIDRWLQLPKGQTKAFWQPLPPLKWNNRPRTITRVAIPKKRF